MLRRRNSKGRPFVADNALLRRRFEEEHALPPRELDRPYAVVELWFEVQGAYRAWLDRHGIDPDTGKMTKDGLAFFRELVQEQNVRNRSTRKARHGRPFT